MGSLYFPPHTPLQSTSQRVFSAKTNMRVALCCLVAALLAVVSVSGKPATYLVETADAPRKKSWGGRKNYGGGRNGGGWQLEAGSDYTDDEYPADEEYLPGEEAVVGEDFGLDPYKTEGYAPEEEDEEGWEGDEEEDGDIDWEDKRH